MGIFKSLIQEKVNIAFGVVILTPNVTLSW